MSVIAIIQCRLGSTRFPRKALAALNGKAVIRHVVERALHIQGVDRVIVATPWGDAAVIAQELPEDERLSVFAARVDDDDVLGRFVAALKNYPECHTVMRLTGDTPLLDPTVCQRVLELKQRSICDYAWTDTHAGDWPDGLDCEVFNVEALVAAHYRNTEPSDREHVTPGIRRRDGVVALPRDLEFASWPKVSIDVPEDLARVEEFIRAQR